MTQIITVSNQKGGCGKTTIAMGLAGTLGLRGEKVLVVDADTQATASRWAASAEDATPFPATVISLAATSEKLHREILKHAENYDYIVVDCPPSVESHATHSALLVSDIVIVPMIPSPADLWAARGIKLIIEQAAAINEDLRSVIVANMTPRTALGRDVLAALEEFGMPLSSARLGQRTAFREAALVGSPIQSLGSRGRDAAAEIDAVTDDVLSRISQHAPGGTA